MKTSIITLVLGFLFFSCIAQPLDRRLLTGTWVMDKGTYNGAKVFDRSDVNVSINADLRTIKELTGKMAEGADKRMAIANSTERFNIMKGLRYYFTSDSVKVTNAMNKTYNGTYVIDANDNIVTCHFIEKEMDDIVFKYRANTLMIITGFKAKGEEYIQVYIKSK